MSNTQSEINRLRILHRPLMNWTDLNTGAAIAFVWALLWALNTPGNIVWGYLVNVQQRRRKGSTGRST